MIRNAIIVVIIFGVAAFITRNVFYEEIAKVPQKRGVATRVVEPGDREIFRGQFEGMDGIHNVVGDAVVVETQQVPVLRFEKFSTTPGPDLVVYLSKNEKITFNKDLGDQYVTLGSLQKMSGEQNYSLPENYTDYKSVVIWSRALKILFGAAPIK